MVLTMLNDAITLQDTGRFCTVAYARLEPFGSRETARIGDDRFQAGMMGQLLRAQLLPATWVAPHARVTVACGGHPLPHVGRRGGAGAGGGPPRGPPAPYPRGGRPRGASLPRPRGPPPPSPPRGP